MSATHQIKSPIPGIFYRRPSPADDPFVEVGAVVEAGQTIGMVEIMKSFHQIASDVSGEVVSIAEDQAEVSPGTDVAEIRTTDSAHD